MGKTYKLLEDFAVKFINEHFSELDLDRLDWDVTKEEAVEEIKNKPFMVGWVISEVMSWGTKVDYISKYVVENENEDFLIKIEGRFFLIDYKNRNFFYEVFPKKVIVEKYIYERLD